MYNVYRIAASIAPKLPRSLRRLASKTIGTLSWILARRERAHVTANVSQVMANMATRSLVGQWQTQLAVRRVFCNCIDNYLELFALSERTMDDIVSRLDLKGLEHALEAYSCNRGIVLFSAHLGPFECLPFVIAEMLSDYKCELLIPVEKLSDERLLDLMLKMRRRGAISFIPLDGVAGILAMLEALRNNKMVLVTADRAIRGRSADIKFFGATARLPQGAIDLALRTGAPLIGAFAWRTLEGRIACEFTRLTFALPVEQRSDRNALRFAMTRQLEAFIGEHVDEWMVFESVWQNSPV
jgi:KDO2-lipid IV(A) lauroyltransferase